jgi:hypothetical protein
MPVSNDIVSFTTHGIFKGGIDDLIKTGTTNL